MAAGQGAELPAALVAHAPVVVRALVPAVAKGPTLLISRDLVRGHDPVVAAVDGLAEPRMISYTIDRGVGRVVGPVQVTSRFGPAAGDLAAKVASLAPAAAWETYRVPAETVLELVIGPVVAATDLVVVVTGRAVASCPSDPVAAETAQVAVEIDQEVAAVVIDPGVVATDLVAPATVTGLVAPATAIGLADLAMATVQIAQAKVAEASNGVPEIVTQVGLAAETIPITDPIAITGIGGAVIVTTMCGTIGTTTGITIPGTSTTGTPTIGGTVIPTGRGATRTILIIGVWRLGLWRQDGLIMDGPSQSPTTMATMCTTKVTRSFMVRNRLPQ